MFSSGKLESRRFLAIDETQSKSELRTVAYAVCSRKAVPGREFPGERAIELLQLDVISGSLERGIQHRDRIALLQAGFPAPPDDPDNG